MADHLTAMDLADEIRARYARSQKAHKRFRENNLEGISEDTGHAVSTVRRAINGGPTTIPPEVIDQWRHRLAISAEAKAEWTRHCFKTLIKEYRMSTDTFNKIIDSGPETPSAVAQFLQRGFNL